MLVSFLNVSIQEITVKNFRDRYCLKDLVKESLPATKTTNILVAVDFILTYKALCFQRSCVIETGLSDFHKIAFAALKVQFRILELKITYCRGYKYLFFLTHLKIIFLGEITFFYK